MSQFFTSGSQNTGDSAFSISPSNGLISFRINWFDLLAVQEILKSLLQLHSSKVSILWCSAFFRVQLSLGPTAFFFFFFQQLSLWSNSHYFPVVVFFSSVQFSHSAVSESLWPHESQHTRPLCPSPTPGVYSNSRPLSQWCHPAISSSVILFSSCPQSLPVTGSFPMSQLLAWGGQSIGVSALASVVFLLFIIIEKSKWLPAATTVCNWKFWTTLQDSWVNMQLYHS